MIRDIKKINREGLYFADFRYDEGVRVREDPISPTLCKNHDMRSMANAILLIEITEAAQDKHGVLLDDGREVRIRKLTPKECFRFQGFPDEYYERAAQVCSDSQLYKQAGNSVTVNVIYEIAKRL